MKRSLMAFFAVFLGFGLADIAHATVYDFQDKIDYWNLAGTDYGEFWSHDHPLDSVVLNECHSLYYTHDINDDVDLAGGDEVISAELELDFTNDFYDYVIPGIFDKWVSDPVEHIYYAFDGSAWTYLDEVDNGQYKIGIDVSLLNTDGQLSVGLAVSNWDNGNTDAWLDHSILSGTAETATVPEPSTIMLMGTCLLGLFGCGHRRFLKKK